MAQRLAATWWRAGALALTVTAACSGSPADSPVDVPAGFPGMRIPTDNPVTPAKVQLGRYLFYDKRLSGNQTQACATCHQQKLAFTDGQPVGVGSTGQHHIRGPMSLSNAGYASTLTWANPTLSALEKQALVPMFGDMPVELGLTGMEDTLIARLSADPNYPAMFAAAFPDAQSPISVDTVTKAIASFERTLVSGRSPYDRYQNDNDDSAISDSAKRGKDLFFGERLECFHCHGGYAFSDAVVDVNTTLDETSYQNNGLYNIGGDGSYPTGNQGIYEFSHQAADKGRFRAPTLRNIALTAPYMHDGSLATLDDVLNHYSRGGTLTPSGPNAGDGKDNPNKSSFIRGFTLSDSERQDVLEFLRSLTDTDFITDPRFSDPFASP
jgi:cytochrome c peroxidase